MESASLKKLKATLLLIPASIPKDAYAFLAQDPGERATLDDTIAYLGSDEAVKSLNVDPYWPKWNSPWWHASLLFEMGLGARIPERMSRELKSVIQRQYVSAFFAADVPAGRDPKRDTFCHCSLGCSYQFLSAAGVNADEVAPYAREWFLRYQMPDGGLNCDESAYSAKPPASSIVGTLPPLEAMLLWTAREFTADEARFLDRGARNLIERELRLGSTTEHNAEERKDEADWLKLCFPRFYFYDVLRGLTFITRWAEARKQTIPAASLQAVVDALVEKSPVGVLGTERLSYEGVGTRIIDPETGKWTKQPQATRFPLLQYMSRVDQFSRPLTAEWTATRRRLALLIENGFVT